jgi:hypothetical protein
MNTTTNTTTTTDTHALIDIGECELLASGTLADAMQEVAEWNADMGTAFASIAEFNRGQEFYRIVTILDPQGAHKATDSIAGVDFSESLRALASL